MDTIAGSTSSATWVGPTMCPLSLSLVERGKDFYWIYRLVANPGVAEGRHPAAHSGLGAWVGARVASPRCPILRPGGLSVSHHAGAGQGSHLAHRRVSTVTYAHLLHGGPNSLRAAEFRTGVISAATWRGQKVPGAPTHVLAAARSVGLLPAGAPPFGCHGWLPYKQRHDHTRFFSSMSSISRYCCTRAKLH